MFTEGCEGPVIVLTLLKIYAKFCFNTMPSPLTLLALPIIKFLDPSIALISPLTVFKFPTIEFKLPNKLFPDPLILLIFPTCVFPFPILIFPIPIILFKSP